LIGPLLVAVLGFTNLTPSTAVDAALAHSPDVAAARARVLQSAASLAAARGTIVPSLAANYAQTPQGNPPGPNVISRLVTVGLQTNVADLISYGPAVRQQALLLESSRDDEAVAERDERIKTLGLYYEALKARAIASARDGALAAANAERDAARKRYDAGDAPKLDLIRADVAVAKATADLESARAADRNATEALRVETGLTAVDLKETADTPSATVAATPTDPDALVRRALAVRAEIASSVAAEHAAEAARALAQAAGFPALSLTGGYTAGTDSAVPIGAASVNVSLALPLGPSPHAKVRVEDGKVQEAAAKVASAKQAVTLEVAASARSLGALERAAAASTQARAELRLEVDATELGYRNGASSSLELTPARAAYAQALVDELSALYDVEKARSTLQLQVGR
jgi:outer membrane protein TolC